jgi:hypothetical protein
MNIYRLSSFLTPVSFRWTIPLSSAIPPPSHGLSEFIMGMESAVNVLPTSPYSWRLHSGGTSAGTIALLIVGKLTTNDDFAFLSYIYFPLLCVLSMVAITYIPYHWLSLG